MTKKILFISGTRADFGKIKSLIKIVEGDSQFKTTVFVTGMHLQEKYGYTLLEFEKCGITNIYTFENHTDETTMDLTLAKTIQGLSEYVQNSKPDLIVIHGDRVEALAGAIVGSLNNILVAHIEGGEVSGTIDELIRHSTSKMSHIHFTSNDLAKKRLIQMGEIEESIFTIGSPDVDIMFSESLPSLEVAKEYYDIHYAKYAIVMFHPVTTEHDEMQKYAEDFVEALLLDDQNYGSFHFLLLQSFINIKLIIPYIQNTRMLRPVLLPASNINNRNSIIRCFPYSGATISYYKIGVF